MRGALLLFVGWIAGVVTAAFAPRKSGPLDMDQITQTIRDAIHDEFIPPDVETQENDIADTRRFTRH